MQKPFISFPDGAPGIGLLLLRLAVGATLTYVEPREPVHGAILLIAAIVAIALAIGFTTRIAAVLVAVLQLAIALRSGFAGGALEPALIAQALALALLGAGAYSLDSRLFGRRLIFESRGETRSHKDDE